MTTLAATRNKSYGLELMTHGYWPVECSVRGHANGRSIIEGCALGMDDVYQLDELVLLCVKVH